MPRIFGSASTGSGGTPGGSTTQVQYNNAGAFGGVTGATTNGTFLTLTTPVLGVASGTSLALGGATIGSNALAVTGTANIGGALTTTSFVYISGGADNRLLFGSSVDTSLSKVSAGVIGIGTGTQGSIAGGLQAATVALGGATLGSNALAVTGTSSLGAISNANSIFALGTAGGGAFGAASNKTIGFQGGSASLASTSDAAFSRISAGVIGVGTGAQGSVAGGLQAATLALGGATIGSHALAMTGTVRTDYPVSSTGFYAVGNGNGFVSGANSGEHQASINPYGVRLASDNTIEWSSSTSSGFAGQSLVLRRAAAATLQHGAVDSATPVAQSIKFQDVLAGTTNTAAPNATIQLPAGTGTGNGGLLAFQFAAGGSTGSAKNAWAQVFEINQFGVQVSGGGFYGFAGRGGFQASSDGAFKFRNAADSQSFLITVGASNLAIFNGGVTAAGGGFVAATGSSYRTNARGEMQFSGDGVVTFYNNAATNSFSITAGASNVATFNGGITANGLVTMSQGRFPSSSGVTLDSSTRGVLRNPSDGLFVLSNWTETDLTGLVLGPNSATGIRLAKSSTTLQVKLGDSSAFTAVQGKLTTDTAYTAGDPTTTGYLLVYDSTGTAYRVPALLN